MSSILITKLVKLSRRNLRVSNEGFSFSSVGLSISFVYGTSLVTAYFLVFAGVRYSIYKWDNFWLIKIDEFLNAFKGDTLVNVTTKQIEDANDESVQRTIYAELKQELREKEEMISTLNHKIAYLESSMKLKDMRISSLAAQILQNAVEMDQSAKSQSIDARVKLRSRSHNFHETKAN